MEAHNVEEFEIENVETCRVELRNLYLFQERFTQDADRNGPESEEHWGEILEHELAYFDFPEELN